MADAHGPGARSAGVTHAPPRHRTGRSRSCSSGGPRRTRGSSRTEAERIARLCHLMAERFARGGRLVAFGALAGRRAPTCATSPSSSCIP